MGRQSRREKRVKNRADRRERRVDAARDRRMAQALTGRFLRNLMGRPLPDHELARVGLAGKAAVRIRSQRWTDDDDDRERLAWYNAEGLAWATLNRLIGRPMSGMMTPSLALARACAARNGRSPDVEELARAVATVRRAREERRSFR